MVELAFTTGGTASDETANNGWSGGRHNIFAKRQMLLWLLPLALAMLLFAPASAKASNVRFVGTAGYSYVGNLADLTASKVQNFDFFGYSGTLHLELWALPAPYSGGTFTGYKLAEYTLGQLTAGFYYYNIDSGPILFAPPPDGTWNFVLMLTEYTFAPYNNGYSTEDWTNFPTPVVIGPPQPPPPSQTAVAVEYYYAAWNFYFETAFPDEIAALDGGAFGGVWRRTGQTFMVWPQSNAYASPTCRFFSTAFSPKSSHFYTPFASECAAVKVNAAWQYEAIAFYIQLADANGLCYGGTIPLYRLYNNGMGGAPNHRYTTSVTIFNQMVAAGWIFEGNGNTKVFACVPP